MQRLAALALIALYASAALRLLPLAVVALAAFSGEHRVIFGGNAESAAIVLAHSHGAVSSVASASPGCHRHTGSTQLLVSLFATPAGPGQPDHVLQFQSVKGVSRTETAPVAPSTPPVTTAPALVMLADFVVPKEIALRPLPIPDSSPPAAFVAHLRSTQLLV